MMNKYHTYITVRVLGRIIRFITYSNNGIERTQFRDSSYDGDGISIQRIINTCVIRLIRKNLIDDYQSWYDVHLLNMSTT